MKDRGRFTPAEWTHISAIFAQVLEAPPAERDALLAKLCGSDEDISREVESLLEADREAGKFGEAPLSAISEWAAEVSSSAPYDRLGPYELLGVAGHGGMGTVYRARRADDEFQREAAIKVVSRGMNSAFILRRFRQERQILANLTHPNITTLLDGGSTPDGLPYLVMEFVAGEPITDHCDARQLDLRERVLMFGSVCRAVAYAHDKHVIHCDLKPSNILVNSEGVPKLLDFGIARILNPESEAEQAATMTAHRLLTPLYASPERLAGAAPSPAGDVYSLGVILWELVTGERPYTVPAGATADNSWEREPAPPGETAARAGRPWARIINRELEAIMRKAVRQDPRARYSSAQELADDLSAWLKGEAVTALRDHRWYRVRRALVRYRYAAAAALAVLAGLGIWLATPKTPPPITVTALTNLPGLELYPSVSPDARQVVFSWSSTAGGQFDLYTQPLAGGNPVRLTTDPHDDISPTWSPDGRSLAFLRRHDSRGEATVYILSLDSMEERPLFETRIADQELLELDAGGYLSWHPRDPWLAVSALGPMHGLFLVDTITGESRKLVTGQVEAPAFSPNGREVAYILGHSGYAGEIYRLRLTADLQPAGAPDQLTSQVEHVASPTWHPEGGRLFYLQSLFQGEPSLWQVSPSRPGSASLLKTFEQQSIDLSNIVRGSNGSLTLVAAQGRDDINVWTLDDPKKQEPKQAPVFVNSNRGDSGAEFSPDGSLIALQSNRSGAAEIWVCRADGSEPRQISSFGGAFIGLVEWSPDGKDIVTHARTPEGIELFDLPVYGGTVRQLTHGPKAFELPSISRDNQWIYALQAAAVWRIPRWGGAAQKIAAAGSDTIAVDSFDGKLVYYSKNVAGKYSLWQVPTEGGEGMKILDGLADQSAFRPVEDGIYIVAEGTPPVIQFYDFRTRSRRVVARLPKPYGWGIDAVPRAAGKPRKLLVSMEDLPEEDLVRVENLR